MTDGTVVTFYSYKGGVGRTFALANVAAALAGWGYRVLCVDWDLEAPGLSHYFDQWMPQPPSSGLVDLMEEVAAGRTPDVQSATTTVFAPGLDDRLALISAGRQDEHFVGRVQQIDWSSLYEEHELGVILEQLRADWLRRFDFVLIDSRTGITDIGGICTVQLPDILAVIFTANLQSLEGAIDVAERANEARNALPYDRSRLLILPIPSRFDAREEYDRAMIWQRIFIERLTPFYADWVVKETTPAQLIERTTIPYFARWSFGEELPVVTETARGPDYVSFYIETLAAVVAHRLGRSDLLADSSDSYIDAARRAGLRGGHFEFDVLITCESDTQPLAQELAEHLRSFGIKAMIADDSGSEKDHGESDRILAKSQHLAVMVGEEMTRRQRREVEQFIKQTADEGSERTVFPVLGADTSASSLPSLLQRTEYYDTRERSVKSIATEIAFAILTGSSRDSDHLTAAQSLSDLADVLRDEGDLARARTLYERALAIQEAHFGPNHPATAQSLSNLAGVLRDLGDLQTARTLYERALAVHEAHFGPNHPATAQSLSDLADVLRDEGDLARARTLYERALAIQEALLGPDHPATAQSLSNLAGVLRDLGDLQTARTLYERALAVQEAHLDSDPLAVAVLRNNLGLVMQDLGDSAAARAQFEQALVITEAALGPDHPTEAIVRNNLGLVLRDLGDLDQARALYERALTTYEARLGPNHPDTAQTLSNLASVLHDQGDLRGARTLYERALAIYETSLGPEHPDTAQSLSNLGLVLAEQGRIPAARHALNRALSIYQRRLGPNHPTTLQSRRNLSELNKGSRARPK